MVSPSSRLLAIPRAAVLLAACAAFAAFLFAASSANADPGALRIMAIDSYSGTDVGDDLIADIAAQSGVQTVTRFKSLSLIDSGDGATPTSADLAGYDAVIALNDYRWGDSTSLGNLLADFVDQGGVVIAPNWNFWDSSDAGYALAGRWASGGYSPFLQTQSGSNSTSTLTAFDPAHPFFAGVTGLQNGFIYSSTIDPSAIQLASWANGQPAVALKGRVVGINGLLYDSGANTGEYGRFLVNEIAALVPQTASVALEGNGAGKVKSTPAGIDCGTLCSARFAAGSDVTYTATAAKGSVFAGWQSGCQGNGKCLFKVAYPSATSSDWTTPGITARFASVKLKIGKLKKGVLSVKVPSAGKLSVSASGVASASVKAKRAGTVKLKIKATGAVKRKLASKGSARVKLNFGFKPSGVSKGGKSSKSVTLTK